MLLAILPACNVADCTPTQSSKRTVRQRPKGSLCLSKCLSKKSWTETESEIVNRTVVLRNSSSCSLYRSFGNATPRLVFSLKKSGIGVSVRGDQVKTSQIFNFNLRQTSQNPLAKFT